MTERQGLRCPFAADGHREDEDDKDEAGGLAAEVFEKINEHGQAFLAQAS